MLFRQDALDRIRSGRVVFRRWRQVRVRAGTRLRTRIGLIEVRSPRWPPPAGYDSVEAVRAGVPGQPLFRPSLEPIRGLLRATS